METSPHLTPTAHFLKVSKFRILFDNAFSKWKGIADVKELWRRK